MKKSEQNLKIGDLSTTHALPVVPGPRGSKFVYISAESVANLIRQGFPTVNEVLIVDTRYGYEFNGGHIKNAINVSSQVRIIP